MGEFLSAGIFNEEIPSGESAILGVSTSNFGTVGWTPRGKENEAILATSLQDYFRKFGEYWKNSDTPLAVTAFFKNGGARLYFVRVTPSDAVAASGSIGAYWNVEAISKGTWGNLVKLKIVGNENFYNFSTATYTRFDIKVQEESADGEDDFEDTEIFEAVSLDDSDDANYFPEVLNDDTNGSETAVIAAGASPGIPSAFDSTPVAGEVLGSGDDLTTLFTKTLASPPVAPFTVKIRADGGLEASDNGRGVISLDDSASGGFSSVSGTIDYDTGDLAVDFTPAPSGSVALTVDYYAAGDSEVEVELSGGLDGTEVVRAQVTDPVLETDNEGLYALNLVDEILNVGLADFSGDVTVAGDLIAFAEGRKDAFIILDTARGIDAQDAKNYKLVTLASQSSYAAMYYPGIEVADPVKDGKARAISPIGHIAGVYARTANNRNVGKAPAGVNEGQLNFAVKLETVLSKGQRDILYPANVNPLMTSPAVGKAVWGARTLAVAGDFTLVNVRLLFIFLEKSVFNSTHDLVFEPIGTELFGQVKLRLDGFMNALTQDGYFASRVPSEAFRVVIDDTNNTPATIAARQLITDILVAAQTPAEFVRFRFQRSLTTIGS